MSGFPQRFVLSGVVCALVVAGGVMAWAVTTGSSEAQSGTVHGCPAGGKWSIAVWDGAGGTPADDALAACGEGNVSAAYSLDPQTGNWWRWFAGKPDVSNLSPLNDMQGVLALGGMVAAGATAEEPLAVAQASGQFHNCPPAGRWSIAVWDGASGTAAGDALGRCGAGAVAAAYALDPQTGGWLRWFANNAAASNMPPFGGIRGVLALASATGAATPTPSATPTWTPIRTATATPSRTATPTPTRTSTPTPTPASTPTRTPTAAPTLTPEPTPAPTFTPSPTASAANSPPVWPPPHSIAAMTSYRYDEDGHLIGAVTGIQIFTPCSDPDGDPLAYAWTASNGSISGSGLTATWINEIAGAKPKDGTVTVTCSDGRGGSAIWDIVFDW
jgi:hypothetical protein